MDRSVISPKLRKARESGKVCRGLCGLGRDLKHTEALARGSLKRKHVQSPGTLKTASGVGGPVAGAKGPGGRPGGGGWRSWQGSGHARPGQPHQELWILS